MNETKNKLIQLKQLLLEVTEGFEKDWDKWHDITAGNHYPFDNSFDEVVDNMVSWIDQSVKYYDEE